mgnify:CR=1 FL=1
MLKNLALAAAFAAVASPALADYELSAYATSHQTSMMQGLDDLPGCDALQSAYDASGMPRGDSFETVRQIDRIVSNSMRYQADRGGDVWNSFAAEVLNGQRRITADCDDYALTTIALAICAGVPAERLDFVMTQTSGGDMRFSRIDHAVGVYTSPDGDRYVVGDTRRRMHRLTSRNKAILWANASEIGSRRMSWLSSIAPTLANK